MVSCMSSVLVTYLLKSAPLMELLAALSMSMALLI